MLVILSNLSNGEFGLGTAATAVGAVHVSHELDELALAEVQRGLEPLADLLKSGLVSTSATLVLASSARPQTDTVEALPQVDDNAHDLVVALLLELLSDGGKQDLQPDLVIGLALLEGVGPAATEAILGVLPFRPDALLEEMVVGLWSEFGSGSDVILEQCE